MDELRSMHYEAIMNRILSMYEDLAEMCGQGGDIEIYESKMKLVEDFKEGMKKFKENYRVQNAESLMFLPEFFKILRDEYNCDTSEFVKLVLPYYRKSVESQKALLEQELSNLAKFEEALSMETERK